MLRGHQIGKSKKRSAWNPAEFDEKFGSNVSGSDNSYWSCDESDSGCSDDGTRFVHHTSGVPSGKEIKRGEN